MRQHLRAVLLKSDLPQGHDCKPIGRRARGEVTRFCRALQEDHVKEVSIWGAHIDFHIRV